MKYKAVVFDMDGVIFDSEKAVVESWLVTAEKYGIQDVEKVVLSCMGTNASKSKQIFLEYYGEDFPYDAYKAECSAFFHDKYGEGRLPLKPGIRELLTFLREKGYKIGLASSTREEVVVSQLKYANLYSFFDEIICGNMVKESKPAPDIYLLACEKLQVEPKEAVAIEDSYNGIRSAKAAGLSPIMVPDLIPPNEEMEQLAIIIGKDLFEIKDVFF